MQEEDRQHRINVQCRQMQRDRANVIKIRRGKGITRDSDYMW